MKIVAAVFADFEYTFLGGPAQLTAELAGQTVLARTLGRLMRVPDLDGRCLFVRPRDRAAAEAAVGELGLSDAIDVLPLDDGRRPRRELLRAARKWNLDAWRGSPLGTTWFDEYVEPLNVARVLDHYECEGVLCLDGHMPALDPEIAHHMLTQQREYDVDARMVFTQAPPGLAGVILRREVTRELLEQSYPVGLLTAYRPEMARPDPINQAVCAQIDPDVVYTGARLCPDTRRGRELLSAALAQLGDDAGASDLCDWCRRPGHDRAGPLPVEVELELTTDDPLPETTLRPRGDRVPRRRLTDLDAVDRLAQELAAYDDRAVLLGGHGDPLAHPQFAEVCRRIRAAGVCGLGVATPLVELSDENLAVLSASKVDVLQIRLDANTAETYRKVHGVDCFEQVLVNVERVEQARRELVCPHPIVVCSLTRCGATLAEMEAFFDRWIRATGWAVIEGYNEYCGELPPDTLLHAGPSVREPCRRLGSRMILLADGTAALCAQDFRGEQPVGNWLSEPLSEIWQGAGLNAVRRSHGDLDLSGLPLCTGCREWFRA